MSESIISIRNLYKTYPTKKQPFVAVDNLSFELHKGEILGLLGPNGAGKSTTISMLLGVLTPTSGSIDYFGKNFSQHQSEILSKVTFASTYIRMPWRLSVMENLRVYGYLYGLNSQIFEKRATKFLKRFGVWEQRDKTMNNLSAGQVTRVMLAKAFIPHPEVVLLDEPTASLDPDIAHQVRSFIREQQQAWNTTILYTSHNMDEVADICDRVIFLKAGKIVAEDTPAELAHSISVARMRLQIKDGLKRIKNLADTLNYQSQIDGREIEIAVDEQHVATFLTRLTKENIEYTQISIAKPTLEDYFLSLSQD